MSIQKNLYGNLFSINFTNLLNERYEKPATYSQDGRAVNISWRKIIKNYRSRLMICTI